MPDLSILIPVLGRPHQIAEILDDIAAATPPVYEVVFLASQGDRPVANALAQVIVKSNHPLKVFSLPPQRIGDYAMKINYGYRNTVTPHMFLGAGDLHFHPGWYDRAVRALTTGIGVVGTNDLGNSRVMRGDHATHSLVTREYAKRGLIDDTHGILFEGYWHEMCDDELVGTAQFRNAWAFAKDSIVEHMHPLWKKAPNDALYANQRKRMAFSRPLYNHRSKLWTST